MQYIQEKLQECKVCQKYTKHQRNATKPNYLLHLILIFVTGGMWIIPFLLVLVGGVNLFGEKYVCSECGTKRVTLWDKFFKWTLIIFFGGFGFLAFLGILVDYFGK